MIKLEKTNHSYYCNLSNHHCNESYNNFETWEDFLDDWRDADLDYNLLFRYDIDPFYNEETDEEDEGRFSLKLFFILQRKGNFIPIKIDEIFEKDLESINEYIKPRYEYMMDLWEEFQKTKK